MRKLLLPALCLFLTLSACSLVNTGPRYGPEAPGYTLSLLPWRYSPMNFTYKYRWTMTQGLLKACAQAGNFRLESSNYYSDPDYGVKRLELPRNQTSDFWVRHKYGKYRPDTKHVTDILKEYGADIGVLYEVSADNSEFTDDGASYDKSDSIRVFLVEAATGRTVSAFIRTDFLRGRGYGDCKQVTLNAFDKFMAPRLDSEENDKNDSARQTETTK